MSSSRHIDRDKNDVDVFEHVFGPLPPEHPRGDDPAVTIDVAVVTHDTAEPDRQKPDENEDADRRDERGT